jgi:galactose mutarotase-like enzyme
MYILENEHITIKVEHKGAQLRSLFSKTDHTEYLWQADPIFWGKSSPVLFPIVGSLVNGTYQYQGKNYQLGRHGFARDLAFEISTETAHSVTFCLKSTPETLLNYPFAFELYISYTLKGNKLVVGYMVQNKQDLPMYFSVGAHPAFKLPFAQNTQYNNYELAFEQKENFYRYLLDSNGLLLEPPTTFGTEQNLIPLSKELFAKDALVFKNLKSEYLDIQSAKADTRLRIGIAGSTHLGLWAAPQAPFVCIEPWWGVADYATHNGDITQKEGIVALAPQSEFKAEWSVAILQKC